MHTTNPEAVRLVLLAACGLIRHGRIDAYALARLAALGVDATAAEQAARAAIGAAGWALAGAGTPLEEVGR